MNILAKRIARSPNYIKAFGFISGMRLLFQNEKKWSRESDTICKINTPNVDFPIYLRNSVSDRSIFWQCIVTTQYETSIFKEHKDKLDLYYENLIKNRNPPIILDCGANIGLSTIYYASKYPEARIVAIEPDGKNFEMLKKNTVAFADRVTLIKGGIWDSDEKLMIKNPDSGASAFTVGKLSFGNEADNKASLQGYSINSIMTSFNLRDLFIVKIDVEGSQKEIFKRNTDWLARTSLLVIEIEDWLFPWEGTSKHFFGTISKMEFDYLFHGENLFCFNHSLKSL